MLGLVRSVLVLSLVAALAGCASVPFEQRTTQGPTAEQVWMYRVMTESGRQPTFEERGRWQDRLDGDVSRYLNEHPDVANAYDVHEFRFTRQVTVGMRKDQVTILLGTPDAVVTDAAQMEKLAARFWNDLKGKATETWVYPLGWRVYFAEDRVVALTQYLPKKLM